MSQQPRIVVPAHGATATMALISHADRLKFSLQAMPPQADVDARFGVRRTKDWLRKAGPKPSPTVRKWLECNYGKDWDKSRSLTAAEYKRRVREATLSAMIEKTDC